jgi:hypothetical protein
VLLYPPPPRKPIFGGVPAAVGIDAEVVGRVAAGVEESVTTSPSKPSVSGLKKLTEVEEGDCEVNNEVMREVRLWDKGCTKPPPPIIGGGPNIGGLVESDEAEKDELSALEVGMLLEKMSVEEGEEEAALEVEVKPCIGGGPNGGFTTELVVVAANDEEGVVVVVEVVAVVVVVVVVVVAPPAGGPR